MRKTIDILRDVKEASFELRMCTAESIDQALMSCAKALEDDKNIEKILQANGIDLEKAKDSVSQVMLDRLLLTEERIKSMANGIREVVQLPSPLGVVLDEYMRPNGLNIKKVSAPMGVMAVIYESRPNVTSDAAALSLKSGSACILRTGKEAYNTSFEIVKVIREAIGATGLPKNAVNLIEDTTRQSALELMKANGYVDLLIPRGGKGLIDSCVQNATVPCIQTGTGVCHVYVHKDADLNMALDIIDNAKTSRPSVCNAAETLLVDRDIADVFLPAVKKRLAFDRIVEGKEPVRFKCPREIIEILSGEETDESGFDVEHLDYVLSVKVVSSIDEAIGHIRLHSTGHSESIVTDNSEAAQRFSALVDSAAVYVNASTRFTDGGEFGFGCEIGISTQKLHARGPLGLRELVSYKYVIEGKGQVR